MKKALSIFVGFVHDFAAGCWAATVIAIYWLHRLPLDRPEIKSVISPLKKEFFFLGLACVGIVLITGMGRTFTYAGNIYGEDAEKLRRRMLIVKHIVLFSAFGAGIYWQYIMVYR